MEIRSDLLSTFERGCDASLKRRLTFNDWLLNGTGNYSVTSIGNNDITISASSIDLSSAFLTDIELLFNHCFEHLQELIVYHTDNKPRSDAWNVVTLYYFSFFTAQIFSRLIGSPIVYIGPQQINNLKIISGVAGSRLGAGAYRIEKLTDLASSMTEYRLKKTNNSKIHEATWISLFSYLESKINTNIMLSLPEEVLFYKLITTNVLHEMYDGYSWPSVIRTKANYRPGFMYRNVDNNIKAKTKGLLNPWIDLNKMSELNKLLSSSVAACRDEEIVSFSNHVQLLHGVSQSIFLLCRQLYSELLDRSDINKIWELHRTSYVKNMSCPEGKFLKLIQTY